MTTVKNHATFLLTPPQRIAIIELACAYAEYRHLLSEDFLGRLPLSAKRLRDAQNELGIELVPINHLEAIERQAA